MVNFFRIKADRTLIHEQKGVTSIEYGLIAVALSALVVVILYGNPNGFIWAVTSKLEQLASLVSSALSN